MSKPKNKGKSDSRKTSGHSPKQSKPQTKPTSEIKRQADKPPPSVSALPASVSISGKPAFATVVFALIILAVGIAIYFQSVGFGYTYLDDNKFIGQYHRYAQQGESLLIPFEKTFGVSYYRPMLGVSLLLDAYIAGSAEPLVYHITNIVLHLLCSILVFLVLLKLRFPNILALFLALFFTVSPVLTPAVSWIAGRNDSLIALFILP